MPDPTDSSSPSLDPLQREELWRVWESLCERRVSYHAALWQTPALSMTAQAFLMTIALGAGTSALARLLSAALALLVAVVTLQMLVRHRTMELLDWLTLEGIERQLGLGELLGIVPHARLEERHHEQARRRADEVLRPVTRWAPRSFWNQLALNVWAIAQLAFVVVAFVVVALALVSIAAGSPGPLYGA